jgi:hypothetical protein
MILRAGVMPPAMVTVDGAVVDHVRKAGYAAAMAYLPAKGIAIAVTATVGPDGPTEGRPTDALFAKIGAYLVPDQAPIMP